MSTSDSQAPDYDPVELSRALVDITGKSQKLVQDFLTRQQSLDRISLNDAVQMSKLSRTSTAG